jgi:hypothetical protein
MVAQRGGQVDRPGPGAPKTSADEGGKRGGIIALRQAKLLVTVPIDFWHPPAKQATVVPTWTWGTRELAHRCPRARRYVGDGG